ncbi:hypothetical protein GQ55_4G015100 [Panicum hallii var. hallii]|uniref:Uncharacterized protein n=1 Tax=Panicum hallii var. hallii TaxID=1504633 RepID=A0A2T7DU64_9POAL|nr:hypothetical protein GQ55_4G015100 [Panicum hallii var. hallii]
MNGMELKIAARKSLTISAPRFPTSPRRNQDPHPPPSLQPTTEPRQCRHAARSCSQPCQPLRAPARLCPGAETPRALTPAWSAVPARRPRRRRSLDRSRRRGIPAEPAATPVLSPATIARAHNVPGHIRPLLPPATQFPPSTQLQLHSSAPPCCQELARLRCAGTDRPRPNSFDIGICHDGGTPNRTDVFLDLFLEISMRGMRFARAFSFLVLPL